MKLGKVFALKRLKLENEKEGFPITSLREIDMLLKAKHPNVVGVRVSLPLCHTHTHTLSLSIFHTLHLPRVAVLL